MSMNVFPWKGVSAYYYVQDVVSLRLCYYMGKFFLYALQAKHATESCFIIKVMALYSVNLQRLLHT